MKFSVIVPFLNEEEHIEHCLQALAAQTLPDDQFELIFVDNGSTDRSPSIAKSWPGVRCLSEPIKDPYLARNRGIGEARGEIIVFTDADCIATPNWLEAYLRAFSNPAVDMVLGDIKFPGSSGLLRYYEAYFTTKMRLMTSTFPRETCYGHAGNMALRASLFQELGVFPPMPIVGDADIVQKYLQRFPTRRLVFVPEAEVTHLEVTTAAELLKKLYSYGTYAKTFSNKTDFRVSSLREKLLTLSACASEHRYGIGQQLQLLGALIIHYAAFALGCCKATLQSGR
jgi:glycosyltransferase involved in cell wall biosynthesis